MSALFCGGSYIPLIVHQAMHQCASVCSAIHHCTSLSIAVRSRCYFEAEASKTDDFVNEGLESLGYAKPVLVKQVLQRCI